MTAARRQVISLLLAMPPARWPAGLQLFRQRNASALLAWVVEVWVTELDQKTFEAVEERVRGYK